VEVYSTEEEQVQAIQKWWKDNGVSIIAGVVIGLAVIAGYRYWTDHQKSQSQLASEMYSQVLLGAKSDKVTLTDSLMKNYSGTPYASLAALLLAKENVTSNEPDKAISLLQWVIDNTKDDAIKHLAQTRLARVYLSQNKIKAAEALVKGEKVAGFSATYNEIRGDIELAKKMPVQARENYQLALEMLSPRDQRYSIIKMKLDELAQATPGAASK
jgi:predicted negative regulator of RcsB-dependent stress response